MSNEKEVENNREQEAKEKKNLLEKMKAKIGKVAIEGMIAASLLMNPVSSSPYYQAKIYLPSRIDVNKLIESNIKPENVDLVKKIWWIKQERMTKYVDLLVDIEMGLDDLREDFKTTNDKKKMYTLANVLMKIAEGYTFLDTLRKEDVLYEVKERIDEELKKEPNNIDILELKIINSGLLYDMYNHAGYWYNREYELARTEGRKEIRNLREKWKKAAEELENLYSTLSQLKENKKKIKNLPTIFEYPTSEKKRKIKMHLEELEHKRLYIDMDKRNGFLK